MMMMVSASERRRPPWTHTGIIIIVKDISFLGRVTTMTSSSYKIVEQGTKQ